MKPRTLPVKRRPVPHGFFKRIHAVTRHRNQRVAATADDLENPDHSTRISRGFTIIFVIHVVAIALYFIHLNFLNDHSVAQAATATTTETAATPKPRLDNPPIISPNDATCIVVAGDNYSRIAVREGVDETALRAANNNKPVAAGLTLKLPPKRIVAMDSPVVVALRKQTPSDAERGLVEATPVDADESPRAQLVRPKVVRDTSTPKSAARESSPAKTAAARESPPTKTTTAKTTAPKATPRETNTTKTATRDTTAPKAAATTAKRSYVVKPGDNLYRISKRYKIDQADLMRANGISDPSKLNTGATLVIPQ